jgi:hypothetical protein
MLLIYRSIIIFNRTFTSLHCTSPHFTSPTINTFHGTPRFNPLHCTTFHFNSLHLSCPSLCKTYLTVALSHGQGYRKATTINFEPVFPCSSKLPFSIKESPGLITISPVLVVSENIFSTIIEVISLKY